MSCKSPNVLCLNAGNIIKIELEFGLSILDPIYYLLIDNPDYLTIDFNEFGGENSLYSGFGPLWVLCTVQNIYCYRALQGNCCAIKSRNYPKQVREMVMGYNIV